MVTNSLNPEPHREGLDMGEDFGDLINRFEALSGP